MCFHRILNATIITLKVQWLRASQCIAMFIAIKVDYIIITLLEQWGCCIFELLSQLSALIMILKGRWKVHCTVGHYFELTAVYNVKGSALSFTVLCLLLRLSALYHASLTIQIPIKTQSWFCWLCTVTASPDHTSPVS